MVSNFDCAGGIGGGEYVVVECWTMGGERVVDVGRFCAGYSSL